MSFEQMLSRNGISVWKLNLGWTSLEAEMQGALGMVGSGQAETFVDDTICPEAILSDLIES
jgi:hypothetical protein